MVGIGTIINMVLIIVGSFIGLKLKSELKEEIKSSILNVIGIVTLFIGLGGVLEGLLVFKDATIKTSDIMPVIIYLFIGTLIGEFIDIEKRVEIFANKIKDRFAKKSDSNDFVEGFVTTTLLMCVGAMAIIGSLKDALYADPSILFAKGVIDMVAAIIFASVFGIGVMFSSISVGIYQGLITALSFFLKPFITDKILFNISYIGSYLIFALGINLIFDKKIRISNMLPAIVIAIIHGGF